MRQPIASPLALLSVVALTGALACAPAGDAGDPGDAQSDLPRTHDDRPDLNGIWQTNNTAHWDLEDHAARAGAAVPLGAVGAIPAGKSVVQGGEIPYTAEALAQRETHREEWLTADPEIKCYLPGTPRVMYMPFPFQIVQTSDFILIASEYVGATRSVYMTDVEPPPIDTYMGHSVGRWEGDTLVIESNTFTDQTWLDRAGNFHSPALRIVERISMLSPDALQYEATLEDENVYTRPWTISMPIYRRLEPNAEILEFNCVEFVEETMWGHLTKPGS